MIHPYYVPICRLCVQVSKLIWTVFTLAMTLLRLKSSFFCMFWTLLPMLGRAALDRTYDLNPAKRRQKDLRWFLVHLVSLLVPLILHMCLVLTTFTMFIPIMSRAGSAVNPDLIIGYKAASMTLAMISFLCPLVMVTERPMRIITCLYVTTMVTMGLCLFTKLGFPYSASATNLAPHRALVIHTERHFYDLAGAETRADTGYFMVNLDRNSPHVLNTWLPELKEAKAKEQARYCSVPWGPTTWSSSFPPPSASRCAPGSWRAASCWPGPSGRPTTSSPPAARRATASSSGWRWRCRARTTTVGNT